MRASNLGEALQAAGFDQFQHQAQTVAANFIAAGGTREQWLACFDAAERMPGRGLKHSASDSQAPVAPTRQPVEGGEANKILPNGQIPGAFAPSFNRGGVGPTGGANGHAPDARPVREPTPQQRAISMRTATGFAGKMTIFDTFKIDGLALGNWSVARARVEGDRKTREGYVLRECARLVANAPSHALLRDVVKMKELQLIQQKAAEFADAV